MSGPKAFGTVVTRSHLGFARALSESIARWHPDATLTVLLLDQEVGAVSGEDFVTIGPTDLGLPPGSMRQMATIYTALEFAMALKPSLMLHLLKTNPGGATWLDADTYLYAPMGDEACAAADEAMVLTPHVVRPQAPGPQGVWDYDFLRTGFFNLGFLSVGPASVPFLEWWQDCLRLYCLSDPNFGFFVEQRWIDVGAQFFSNRVLSDEAYNVAYWNSVQRPITQVDGRYRVGGKDLVFFHYSGFDPGHPEVLTRRVVEFSRASQPRLECVPELCAAYASRLLSLGHAEFSRIPYGYSTSVGGTRLDGYLRRTYRDEVMAGATGLPDPFDPADSAAFEAWVAAHALTRRARQTGNRLIGVARGVVGATERARNRVRPGRSGGAGGAASL